MAAPIRVEIVDRKLTRPLQRAVLRPNLAPDEPQPGDELVDAVHFAALADDEVLSTCFIYPDPCPWRPDDDPAWHLRQMATADGHRGEGLGTAVFEAVLAYVGAQGGGTLWCNAREQAVPFYAQHGMTGEGTLFTDERHTIPHLRMWRHVDAR